MARSAPLIKHVCSVFGLGEPIADWQRRKGGLSNELRRVDTTTGRFAVKRMVAGTHLAKFRDNVEKSFEVERAAIGAGVCAPRPVSPLGETGCLAEIDCEDGSACWIRVHEWVPGVSLDHNSVSLERAHELGTLIAMVHELDCAMPETLAAPCAVGSEVWNELAGRASTEGALWAPRLASLRPEIQGLGDRMDRQSSRRIVLGHRDADDKNTLLSEEGHLPLD